MHALWKSALVYGLVSFFAFGIFAEEPFRILAIDGGGARGIIAISVIRQLEKDLNKPVTKIFDMLAGTSTGGIIALSLVVPNSNGVQARSAEVVANFGLNNLPRIFNSTYYHWFETLGGLLGPKYQSFGLAQVLQEDLGDTMLSQAVIPTLITGYHLEGEQGIEFYSEDAKKFPEDKDCLMREVAMATSAAPTYFETADVNFSWGVLRSIADGALYKHDPAILAYANAKKLYPNREIEVYSLGTGYAPVEDPLANLKGRGIVQWVSPILRHFNAGGAEADQTVLDKILNKDGKKRYFRVNVSIDKEHRAMDDVSPDNLRYLYRKGIEATRTSAYSDVHKRLQGSQTNSEPSK